MTRSNRERTLPVSAIIRLIVWLILLSGCAQTTARPSPDTSPTDSCDPSVTPTVESPQTPSSPTAMLTPALPPSEVLDITPSPPSTDSVLLARQDGALVLHDMADGHQRVLLDPGLYHVSGDSFLVPILWPVRLSPDGQWLLVPTPRDGTWLVSFDGQVQRQVSRERLMATWAPDSRRIAFTGEKGPREREEDRIVYVQDVIGGDGPWPLARLPESASYPAWSPGCDSVQDDGSGDCGRSVAAFSCEIGEVYTCTAWLIDAVSGEMRSLGHSAPQPTMSGPAMFAWSPAGDEVWVRAWFGARAFPVDGSGPRPLVSVCQSPCGEPSPDGSLRAWTQPIPTEGNPACLVIARADSGDSVTVDAVFQQPEAVRWTNDGRRVLIESYTGDGYTLWAVDPAVGQPELIAEKITFLGTPDELRRSSTEVGARRVTLRTLPAPGDPSTWAVHDLLDLGVRLQVPAEWRLKVQGSGITQTATLANFDFEGAIGNASLESRQIEITFALLPSPPVVNFMAWLSQTVEMEQNQVTAEPITLTGRPAARIRAIVSPTGEEVRVPLDEGELVITRWPISSTHDAVFEQILDSLEFIVP
ncbi:MAG: hypothetical protein SWK90_08770 [Chloroflexota bacterium]|nr:hypothetical protein [Chloroflexota bacterium]